MKILEVQISSFSSKGIIEQAGLTFTYLVIEFPNCIWLLLLLGQKFPIFIYLTNIKDLFCANHCPVLTVQLNKDKSLPSPFF